MNFGFLLCNLCTRVCCPRQNRFQSLMIGHIALSISLSFAPFLYICILFWVCTGKWQVIGTIFIAESFQELKKPHYMKGGPMAELIWPKVDSSGISPEVMKHKENSELNNGRLAMIAIMSFLSERPFLVPSPPWPNWMPFIKYKTKILEILNENTKTEPTCVFMNTRHIGVTFSL